MGSEVRRPRAGRHTRGVEPVRTGLDRPEGGLRSGPAAPQRSDGRGHPVPGEGRRVEPAGRDDPARRPPPRRRGRGDQGRPPARGLPRGPRSAPRRGGQRPSRPRHPLARVRSGGGRRPRSPRRDECRRSGGRAPTRGPTAADPRPEATGGGSGAAQDRVHRRGGRSPEGPGAPRRDREGAGRREGRGRGRGGKAQRTEGRARGRARGVRVRGEDPGDDDPDPHRGVQPAPQVVRREDRRHQGRHGRLREGGADRGRGAGQAQRGPGTGGPAGPGPRGVAAGAGRRRSETGDRSAAPRGPRAHDRRARGEGGGAGGGAGRAGEKALAYSTTLEDARRIGGTSPRPRRNSSGGSGAGTSRPPRRPTWPKPPGPPGAARSSTRTPRPFKKRSATSGPNATPCASPTRRPTIGRS
ncbi:hypothetical protein FTUN_4007 [Frigoriglobus tundricola]|uniref:Uncharacterized protein n=1 Tax=Frigoriglobus tundricola TaxID=2774151 RepID=A0A6M5YSR3_9BACT|nr:hypothetical protein FTUN_4007 [Frigoriglobus tundricola]